MHYFIPIPKVVLIQLLDSSMLEKIDHLRQVNLGFRCQSCPDFMRLDACSGGREPNPGTTCDVQAERKVNKHDYFMLVLDI